MSTDHGHVACSLAPQSMKDRAVRWRRLLAGDGVETAVTDGGVRLVLQPSPELAGEVTRLIALEEECCAWITWTVNQGALLEVRATADQEEGRSLLRAWFAPPGVVEDA